MGSVRPLPTTNCKQISSKLVDAVSELERAMFDALSSPPDLTVWEWLEEYVRTV